MSSEIKIFKNRQKLAETLVANFRQEVDQKIRRGKNFYIALSGGHTPRILFEQLAHDSYKEKILWRNVHLFWGDERCVSFNHVDSNYGMTKKILIDHISIPKKNIHRIRGEANPQSETLRYTKEVQKKLPKGNNGLPCFDWILLGLGMDGHTASLFPQTKVLDEFNQLVSAVFVSQLDSWRITLTLPLINSAKKIFFLVAGGEKKAIVKQVINKKGPTKDLPATLVHPENGKLFWMLDKEVASLIKSNHIRKFSHPFCL